MFEQYKNNSLLKFTIINQGYLPIAFNFIKRIKQLGTFKDMLFVCTDLEAYKALENETYIKTYLHRESEHITKNFVGWKEKEYKELVFNKFDVKVNIIQICKNLNIPRLLFLDTDIWFFKDFEEELINLTYNIYPYADIIIQDGENYKLNSTPIDFYFNNNILVKNRESNRYCTGFVLINVSDKTEKIFTYKNAEVDWTKCVGNQPFFNKLVSITKDINVIPLKRELGLNGSLFNDEGGVELLTTQEALDVIKAKEKQAWFLHYTYMKGTDKIKKMKDLNHWIY